MYGSGQDKRSQLIQSTQGILDKAWESGSTDDDQKLREKFLSVFELDRYNCIGISCLEYKLVC